VNARPTRTGRRRIRNASVFAVAAGLLALGTAVPAAAQARSVGSTPAARRASAVELSAASGVRWDVTDVGSRRSTRGSVVPSYPVEKGLTANAIGVHRAARAAWPEIKTYYGYRNDPSSDHYTGKALDLMIPGYTSSTGKKLGADVAAWAVANQPNLHIQYVIWDQHIWNVSRADEGWRLMADRGSDSANHKNHVHISVQ
jgi:hypothetical protein